MRKTSLPKTMLIVLAIVALAAGAFVGVRYWIDHRSVSSADIPAAGGAQLAASVITPSGGGQHALVVMPTAWGSTQTEYLRVGRLFADHGFLVVAYTQRGFSPSTGEIDFAGTTTVGDVSTVIDWAQKHYSVDTARIGLLGQSYGAGVSLLAAEHDRRIKAVVALSAWSSWGDSFVENNTLVSRSLQSLIGTVSKPRPHLDADMSTLLQEYSAQPAAAIALIEKLSPQRSPIDNVAALNANKTAVMLANGFQDSLLNPQQVLNLYDKLTGPRRLQLATGDHGQAEAPALESGQAIAPIDNALKWMQHYLQGAANGIDTQPPIQVQDSKTGEVRTLASWPSPEQGKPTNLDLPVGAHNYASSAHWTALLGAGPPTAAAAPVEQLTLAQPYQFAPVQLSTVSAAAGLRWDTEVHLTPLLLQGNARVTFSLTANSPSATVYAYLYDVTPTGSATLMTVAPDSFTGLSGKVGRPVTLTLPPMAWTVPAGDHVSLLIGASDPKWTSAGKVGSVVGISSTAAQPATLRLPAA